VRADGRHGESEGNYRQPARGVRGRGGAHASFVDDLGADSLDVVELVMEFEEAFDLEIPDTDAEKIVTVADAVRYIESRLG